MVDVRYSVDMVNISSMINTVDFTLLTDMLPKDGFWESTKIKEYRYNWSIDQGDGESFWIGYKHNTCKPANQYKMKIKFNPNKVKRIGILKYILDTFFNKDRRSMLVNQCNVDDVDFACDIDTNILNIIVDRKRKGRYMFFTENKGIDDMTHYLGKGDGRVKIYNKGNEQGLAINLTRYEITLETKCCIEFFRIPHSEDTFPEVSIVPEQLGIFMDIEDKIMLLGLLQDTSLLKLLSRRKKEKFGKMLKDLQQFKPTKKAMESAYKAFFEVWIK